MDGDPRKQYMKPPRTLIIMLIRDMVQNVCCLQWKLEDLDMIYVEYFGR